MLSLQPALACLLCMNQACICILISLYPVVLFTIDLLIGGHTFQTACVRISCSDMKGGQQRKQLCVLRFRYGNIWRPVWYEQRAVQSGRGCILTLGSLSCPWLLRANWLFLFMYLCYHRGPSYYDKLIIHNCSQLFCLSSSVCMGSWAELELQYFNITDCFSLTESSVCNERHLLLAVFINTTERRRKFMINDMFWMIEKGSYSQKRKDLSEAIVMKHYYHQYLNIAIDDRDYHDHVSMLILVCLSTASQSH